MIRPFVLGRLFAIDGAMSEIEHETPPAPVLREMLSASLGEVFRLPRFGARGAALLAAFGVLGWISTGVYKVQPDEQGVVLRFGKWVDTTPSGLHVHWPYPIETVLFPKVTKVNELPLGEVVSASPVGAAPAATTSDRDRQMLTGDENIVEADCSVFWRIRDAGKFLFSVAEPETALKVEAESALRDVVSHTPIQAAMSDKRQQIADETRALLQKALDAEQAGVEITAVQLQRVEPPRAVIDAFNDVQRARADQERARNEAQAYANDILPRARAEANRLREDAEAYRASVVNLAEGDALSFAAVQKAYEVAPVVTGWRLYYESIDAVLRQAGHVIVDTSGRGVGALTPYMAVPDARTYVPPPPPPPSALAPGAVK
jgi:membrane protease subunit HflK